MSAYNFLDKYLIPFPELIKADTDSYIIDVRVFLQDEIWIESDNNIRILDSMDEEDLTKTLSLIIKNETEFATILMRQCRRISILNLKLLSLIYSDDSIIEGITQEEPRILDDTTLEDELGLLSLLEEIKTSGENPQNFILNNILLLNRYFSDPEELDLATILSKNSTRRENSPSA